MTSRRTPQCAFSVQEIRVHSVKDMVIYVSLTL